MCIFSQDQYIFTHDALLEYIDSGETEVKVAHMSQYLADITEEGEEGRPSRLQQQFKVTIIGPQTLYRQSFVKLRNKNTSKVIQL